MNFAIVLSGGVGTRFNSKIPKQYLKLNGKEVIAYTIDAFKGSKKIDGIVVVAAKEYIPHIEKKYGVKAIQGGVTRNESIKNGLDYVDSLKICEKVIIADSARPMITANVVDFYLEKLNEYDAVITGQKITDSIGNYTDHYLERNDYYLIQAPEAFNFKMLHSNFDKNSKITATNQQMPKGYNMYINFDFVDNIKITHSHDLNYCKALLNEKKKHSNA